MVCADTSFSVIILTQLLFKKKVNYLDAKTVACSAHCQHLLDHIPDWHFAGMERGGTSARCKSFNVYEHYVAPSIYGITH
jgi:hypothetical protein